MSKIPHLKVCWVCRGPKDSYHKNHVFMPERRMTKSRRRRPRGGRRREDPR